MAFVFRKEDEQFIFLWLECEWFIIQHNIAAREVDDEVPKIQLLLLFQGFVSFGKFVAQQTRAPDLGLDTRHQFTHGERFG